MRAFSRLLGWASPLRARMRGNHAAIDRSSPDYRGFALDRYPPDQQREIVKLIARQPVVSRGDIDDALQRAERKARRNGHVTGLAVGVGFVASFTLGVVAARHAPPPPGRSGAPTASMSQAPAAHARNDGHWSPGGLDEADRQFFADLQAGGITSTGAPPPRPETAPVPAAPKPVAARQDSVIQLGAFANAAVANARWQALATQFPALRPLTRTVSTVTRGSRRIYRLRAAGIGAASACAALTRAGATCFVATDAGQG